MRARISGKKTISRFTALAAAAAVAGTMLSVESFSAFAEEGQSGGVNTFTFTNDSVTAADEGGSGFKISGTALTINAAGTYTVTGECAEGSIKIKKGTTDVVLILDSLTLTSTTTAPVSVNSGSSAEIVIKGNNTITDSEDPANETSTDTEVADAFEGAVIKAKTGASLKITGDGTLNVDGSACKNGIKGGTTASVTVGESGSDSFELNINAANSGLASDGELTVNGGSINITSADDGIKSSPDDDDTESKGVMTINGGDITVNAADDAVHGTNEVNILGGNLTVTAGDDAIHSEYALTFGAAGTDGATVNVLGCVEGFEGATVNLISGNGNVRSSDDGVNAANSDLTDYAFLIDISGGRWYINADGDGLDSNGSLNISGGYTEVFGSSNGDNAALDYGDTADSKFTWTGGTVAGIGMSQMATAPTSGLYVCFGGIGMMGGMGGMGGQPGQQTQQGTPPEIPTGQQGQQGQPGGQQSASNISISSGDSIVIKNSSGAEIYSTAAVKSADSVVFASEELKEGETYTLYINGSEAATAAAGEGAQQGVQPGGFTPPDQQTHTHTYVSTVTKAATCTETGVMTYTCVDGDDSYTKVIPATGHEYTTKVVAPTYDSQGYTEYTCTDCGYSFKSNYTAKLEKTSISSAAVKVNNKAYTGKALKPGVTVTLDGVKLVKGRDYTVSYSNNTKVGKGKVTIKGIGKYSGTISGSFIIKPAKTTIKSVKSTKSGTAKVTWKKTAQVTGYQVKISTKKTFKSGVKTVWVKKSAAKTKTVKGLTSGKTYYVKVRAYKTIGGKKYYGKFSAIKKVTVK